MNGAYGHFDTPMGRIFIGSFGDRITRITFTPKKKAPHPDQSWTERPDDPLLLLTHRQVLEFLSGNRRSFSFPLAPSGTPFQQRIWQLLKEIPYGTTVSYREISHRYAGEDRFTRPSAGAIARNPIMLAIPCHRVIGSNGSLVGFGGGLERKKDLLTLERTVLAEEDS